ncbi:MAG: RloB family protein [Micrococcales bacterium]|nr:RloB family protein [Micrococcales bacterium]
MKRSTGKSLKRKVGVRPELRTVVVFCEGQGSEPDYVTGLVRLPEVSCNAALHIEISDVHGVPYTLVDNAVALKKRDAEEVDECWCLFDVEWPQHHPRLAEAVRRANDIPGVQVAVSNPCFEVWLIMHYRDVTAFLTTAEAERQSRAEDGRAGKRINAGDYMSRRRHAVARAKRLEARHRQTGTTMPHDNPSSGVFMLLEAIGADGSDTPATHER